MFTPCTALVYDSTTATRTLKLPTTLLSIACGIRLISFLMMSFLVFGLFSQTPPFRYFLAPWNITEHLNTSGITSHGTDSFRIKPITPGHPIPKISTSLTIFWGGTWKIVFEDNPQAKEDIIRKEIRRIPQEMLSRVVANFNVRVAAVLSYSSVVHGTNIVLITEKV